VGDGGHSVDGAGGYHHAVHRGRAAGEAAADVFDRVVEMSKRFEIGGGFSHFKEGGALSGARHDEMRLHGGLRAQFFEQAPAVDGTAGSGDPYNDSQMTCFCKFFIEILSNHAAVENFVPNSEQAPC
jgi:hypothetical protein